MAQPPKAIALTNAFFSSGVLMEHRTVWQERLKLDLSCLTVPASWENKKASPSSRVSLCCLMKTRSQRAPRRQTSEHNPQPALAQPTERCSASTRRTRTTLRVCDGRFWSENTRAAETPMMTHHKSNVTRRTCVKPQWENAIRVKTRTGIHDNSLKKTYKK